MCIYIHAHVFLNVGVCVLLYVFVSVRYVCSCVYGDMSICVGACAHVCVVYAYMCV